MASQALKILYFMFFSVSPWLLTGCPLVDSSDKNKGPADDDANAEEMCEDLAYWLCGHGESCLGNIPVDECTEALIRDLKCFDAVGVKKSYETCGTEIVDWDCHEGDAPLSCQDAIVYAGDPLENSADTGGTDTAESLGSDNPATYSDAQRKCEALYTDSCEHIALCSADGMKDLSNFTTIRNECIRASEPLFHCEDAVAVSDGYDACRLAIVNVNCNTEETTVTECDNVVLYE